MEVNLYGVRDLEPAGFVHEAECRHRVIADPGREGAQRSIHRRVRVAADDHHAWRDEARLHDDVVNAAAAAVEQVPDLVTRGEFADRGECFGGLARRGREVVIEGEDDLVGIGDVRARHLVLEHLHHEVRAEIVHQHEIHAGGHDVVGLDLRFTALAGENFFNNVHSWCQPSGPWIPVSP